jgi:hypothetical protein
MRPFRFGFALSPSSPTSATIIARAAARNSPSVRNPPDCSVMNLYLLPDRFGDGNSCRQRRVTLALFTIPAPDISPSYYATRRGDRPGDIREVDGQGGQCLGHARDPSLSTPKND